MQAVTTSAVRSGAQAPSTSRSPTSGYISSEQFRL